MTETFEAVNEVKLSPVDTPNNSGNDDVLIRRIRELEKQKIDNIMTTGCFIMFCMTGFVLIIMGMSQNLKKLELQIINNGLNANDKLLMTSLLEQLKSQTLENVVPDSSFNENVNDSIFSNNRNKNTLSGNKKLVSENGKWYLTLQQDGNLVGYSSGKNLPFFSTKTKCVYTFFERISSKTSCEIATKLIVQEDGNLVLYGSFSDSIWATDTRHKGTGPYKLIMRNDRNIVLVDVNGYHIWSSNTNVTFIDGSINRI